jgi:hypothetical protein
MPVVDLLCPYVITNVIMYSVSVWKSYPQCLGQNICLREQSSGNALLDTVALSNWQSDVMMEGSCICILAYATAHGISQYCLISHRVYALSILPSMHHVFGTPAVPLISRVLKSMEPRVRKSHERFREIFCCQSLPVTPPGKFLGGFLCCMLLRLFPRIKQNCQPLVRTVNL